MSGSSSSTRAFSRFVSRSSCGFGLALFELVGEVVLELVDTLLGLESLLEADLGADAGDRVVGPALEVGEPFVGHVERVGDHLDRQRHTELLDELEIDRLTGAVANHASISRVVIERITGSSSAITLGVNAFEMRRR